MSSDDATHTRDKQELLLVKHEGMISTRQRDVIVITFWAFQQSMGTSTGASNIIQARWCDMVISKAGIGMILESTDSRKSYNPHKYTTAGLGKRTAR